MDTNTPLTVVYNDTCPICAREVMAYKRRTGPEVAYVGLSEGRHSALGLGDEEAARSFHVFQGQTRLAGVDAFAALWERMGGLRWLARLVRLPGVHGVATVVYHRVLAPILYAMHRRRLAKGCAVRLG